LEDVNFRRLVSRYREKIHDEVIGRLVGIATEAVATLKECLVVLARTQEVDEPLDAK
jgi:hypothetical protein